MTRPSQAWTWPGNVTIIGPPDTGYDDGGSSPRDKGRLHDQALAHAADTHAPIATYDGSRGGGPHRRRRRGGAGAGHRQELADRQARGAGGRDRPREVPQDPEGGAAARGAGQGRQAAAGGRARRPGPAGHQAAARDRQVRRHVARRLHGPGRLLERLPLLLGAGPPDVLGLHGRQGRAEPRPGPRDAGRRARVARAPAPRHEVERRQAVHRRRLRVLVRGHLPEQGPRPHAVGGHGHQRQAGRDREGRHPHGAVQVPRALLHAARRAGRLHRPRRAVGRVRGMGGFAPATT